MRNRLINFTRLGSRLMANRRMALLLITGLCLATVVFIYTTLFRQQAISENVAAELGNILADDMLHNESVADVTSLLYLRLKEGSRQFTPPTQEYDAQHQIYGVNISDGVVNPDYDGTLQSNAPLPMEALLIARSIDRVRAHENIIPHRHLIVRRYFLPIHNNYIYLYNRMPTSKYVFASYGGTGFDVSQIDTQRNYFNQKLNNTIAASAGKISPIYQDVLTGRPTLSIEHAIFDLTSDHGNVILGTACIDYELNTFIKLIGQMGYPAGHRYLNVAIEDKLTGTQTRILDNGHAYVPSDFAINPRYIFTVSINPVKFYLSRDGYPVIMAFLALIAAFVVMIIVNARQIYRHKQEAITDPLTSLYNRKWLLGWEQHRNPNINYIVTLVDCNHFKEINDTHGHGVGDDALKYIASTITNNIRADEDYAVRMGGDEFVILFQSNNVAGAYQAIQRIIRQLVKFHDQIPLSISYGFAVLNKNTPLISAISQADQRMYVYKKTRLGGHNARRTH